MVSKIILKAESNNQIMENRMKTEKEMNIAKIETFFETLKKYLGTDDLDYIIEKTRFYFTLLEKHKDLMKIFHKRFTESDARKICSALSYNNNEQSYTKLQKYIYCNFNAGQILELIDGIHKGVDVSFYAYDKIPAKDMAELKCEIEGYSSFDYVTYQKKYGNVDFNFFQKAQILKGMHNDVNVEIYADTKYDKDQMKIIRWGLEHNKENPFYEIDVSLYCDERFSFQQMNEIRARLIEGIPASKYADPYLDEEIMFAYRRSMLLKKTGVDIGKYCYYYQLGHE